MWWSLASTGLCAPPPTVDQASRGLGEGLSPGEELLASLAPSECKVQSVRCEPLAVLGWPLECGCPARGALDADPPRLACFEGGAGRWGSGPQRGARGVLCRCGTPGV